ncbi:MAG TPA: hypothetical protein VMS92_16910 [Mycobacterium sp.]|nr:hypothetical protein [Mycobacterium sp.]
MPAGIAGASNRQQASTIERQIMSATAPATVYGVMMSWEAGGTNAVRLPAPGDTAPSFAGLLVRPYPTNSSNDGLNTSTPMTSAQGGEANIMKRGYMTVRLYGATPVTKGLPVQVSLATAGSDVPGGITATPVATNIINIPNCYFMGPAFTDPNTANAGSPSIVEIAYNI